MTIKYPYKNATFFLKESCNKYSDSLLGILEKNIENCSEFILDTFQEYLLNDDAVSIDIDKISNLKRLLRTNDIQNYVDKIEIRHTFNDEKIRNINRKMNSILALVKVRMNIEYIYDYNATVDNIDVFLKNIPIKNDSLKPFCVEFINPILNTLYNLNFDDGLKTSNNFRLINTVGEVFYENKLDQSKEYSSQYEKYLQKIIVTITDDNLTTKGKILNWYKILDTINHKFQFKIPIKLKFSNGTIIESVNLKQTFGISRVLIILTSKKKKNYKLNVSRLMSKIFRIIIFKLNSPILYNGDIFGLDERQRELLLNHNYLINTFNDLETYLKNYSLKILFEYSDNVSSETVRNLNESYLAKLLCIDNKYVGSISRNNLHLIDSHEEPTEGVEFKTLDIDRFTSHMELPIDAGKLGKSYTPIKFFDDSFTKLYPHVMQKYNIAGPTQIPNINQNQVMQKLLTRQRITEENIDKFKYALNELKNLKESNILIKTQIDAYESTIQSLEVELKEINDSLSSFTKIARTTDKIDPANPSLRKWANMWSGLLGCPVFLVGSQLVENSNPNDVDVIIPMDNKQFSEMFGDVNAWATESSGDYTSIRWNWWSYCNKIKQDGINDTGLKLDVKIQPYSQFYGHMHNWKKIKPYRLDENPTIITEHFLNNFNNKNHPKVLFTPIQNDISMVVKETFTDKFNKSLGIDAMDELMKRANEEMNVTKVVYDKEVADKITETGRNVLKEMQNKSDIDSIKQFITNCNIEQLADLQHLIVNQLHIKTDTKPLTTQQKIKNFLLSLSFNDLCWTRQEVKNMVNRINTPIKPDDNHEPEKTFITKEYQIKEELYRIYEEIEARPNDGAKVRFNASMVEFDKNTGALYIHDREKCIIRMKPDNKNSTSYGLLKLSQNSFIDIYYSGLFVTNNQ